jgi:carbamoyltransferase
MKECILGISAYYHDSAAALVVEGQLIAAAQEERFSRVKHDASFPHQATSYVLKQAGMELSQVTAVVFYEKPFLKFERLLETYHAFAPAGLVSFIKAMPVWIREKVFLKRVLKNELNEHGELKSPVWFTEHHLSHAASAFFPSPFEEAAILTLDGVGEWATSTIGTGRNNRIELLKEMHFPHSLGLLYSAFTYYCGFRVNSGEYKLMGLAPYGKTGDPQTLDFRNKILENLVDLNSDGSILLNMDYFDYATGLKMTRNRKWTSLFGIPPRDPESDISQDYMNLALAIQQVTETIVLQMARHAKELTGCENLVLSGGVALNCVANGLLLRSGLFSNIWIQPAAGDAGGAAGAALAGWYIGLSKDRQTESPDGMSGALLGPAFDDRDIRKIIMKYQAEATCHDDENDLLDKTAGLIAGGHVVGWFQGRMEFGPRALGNRSILGDARNPSMQKKLNLQIKYREGFRPFAPAVTEEKAGLYFDLSSPSPYMLLVAPVLPGRRMERTGDPADGSLWQRLYQIRSDIPAVTHIDYSARVQTVDRNTNPRFHKLINTFSNLTGCDVLVNTSFNVRGEPIVCTPEDAYRCFMSTEMDYLVMENYIFSKKEQADSHLFTRGPKGND